MTNQLEGTGKSLQQHVSRTWCANSAVDEDASKCTASLCAGPKFLSLRWGCRWGLGAREKEKRERESVEIVTKVLGHSVLHSFYFILAQKLGAERITLEGLGRKYVGNFSIKFRRTVCVRYCVFIQSGLVLLCHRS